ncbi:hypothetical protein AB0F17_28560 [Nonomuraea sp. NPDC026600]|uniref:hypothetical protein n=1 Tax=Nonomuraea sp. NPDC026600 TaxID=3155363 RepID=UPI0033DA2A2C
MLFILEYERDITETILREIQADNYQWTGPEKDHIEFLRGGEAVFVVRRSSIITIEHKSQPEPQHALAGPVEAAARASALQHALTPADNAHAVGVR